LCYNWLSVTDDLGLVVCIIVVASEFSEYDVEWQLGTSAADKNVNFRLSFILMT
jgi:hypothetical protein